MICLKASYEVGLDIFLLLIKKDGVELTPVFIPDW